MQSQQRLGVVQVDCDGATVDKGVPNGVGKGVPNGVDKGVPNGVATAAIMTGWLLDISTKEVK
jgi:hypothetical protein